MKIGGLVLQNTFTETWIGMLQLNLQYQANGDLKYRKCKRCAD